MNRGSISLYTLYIFAIFQASLYTSGCPALKEVQISCESSLDCPTKYGCNKNKICAKNIEESALTIYPNKTRIFSASSTIFTAKLDDEHTTNVTWSIDKETEGQELGTIDGSGKYTPPSGITSVLKVTIRATLKSHRDLKALAEATIFPPDDTSAWVMSYFLTGNLPRSSLQDSVHLAYSRDGYRWTELAAFIPEYQLPELGDNKNNHLRDPFVLRKLDGTFVLLASDWTRSFSSSDYWKSPSPEILVADSVDLITFTNPRLLRLTPIIFIDGTPMHARAPKAFYDPENERYGIIWTGNDAKNVNRIYVSYTKDFEKLENEIPTLFFDPGYSVTDATLVQTENYNYLLFVDDRNNADTKDVQIARSASVAIAPGSFSMWSPDYITREDQTNPAGTKSPFVISPEANSWTMCASKYGTNSLFSCWGTNNLDSPPSSWHALPMSTYTMPPNALHASTVRVTKNQLNALISHYGVSTKVKIKSTYVNSNGRPFYLAHSWRHGVFTFDGDTANGQLASDFVFQLRPGSANPDDATLVSFTGTPAIFENDWLYINSETPTEWPTGESATNSNQSSYLSQIPSDQRHHLVFLKKSELTTSFASNVTFKIVPALNGNTSMVSLRWCGESVDQTCNDIDYPRYLSHNYYQVFACRESELCGVDPTNPQAPVNTKNAMSFTLEIQK